MNHTKRYVGIDLGTTNSCIAVMEEGSPRVIPNSHGNLTTPSVVQFLKHGECRVGESALRNSFLDPAETVTGVKRLMGRWFSEVGEFSYLLPYRVMPDIEGYATIILQGEETPPELISALVLRYLRQCAEKYLGTSIDGAIITVPAYFTETQREATRFAGEIAGIKVLRIIEEPTAAAVAFHREHFRLGEGELRVVTFDLGGGTFDVTFLELANINDEWNPDTTRISQVLAVDGDGFIGGDDFDEHIFDWLLEECHRAGNNPTSDLALLDYLRNLVCDAKCRLSFQDSVELRLGTVPSYQNFDLSLSRMDIEYLTEELIERIRYTCKRLLSRSGMKTTQFDSLVLVGGATRMPCVRHVASEIFSRTPHDAVHPDEAVALGAAMYADVLAGETTDALLLDTFSHDIAVRVGDGSLRILLKSDTTVPCEKKAVFSLSNDISTSVEAEIFECQPQQLATAKLLARLQLTDIPRGPKRPRIQIVLDVDQNKIITIELKDLVSGMATFKEVHPWKSWSTETIKEFASSLPRVVN